MTPFRGLSAFPITPTDAHGRVDTEALDHLLERLHAAGVDSIGLLGSTGGYMYLTREERRRAIAAAARSVGGRTPLIVGVGALRTDEAENIGAGCGVRGRRCAPAGAGLLHAPDRGGGLPALPRRRAGDGSAAVHLQQSRDDPLHVQRCPPEALAAVPNIRAVKMPLPKDMDVKASWDV